MSLTGSKWFFFHERRHTRSFLQSFKWFQAILTIYHISPRISPNTKSLIRTLDHRWNIENFQKWIWLAKNDFFHERRHTRSFLQSFKWFQAILTIYHISPRISPDTKSWIRTLDHRWNFENSKNEFDRLKMIFFMKEGIRDHFCKVSSDFKPFWQFTIFHHGFPQIPNHGFGH